MDDDDTDYGVVQNNLANDDWDHATGTYDELKMGNNREIGEGPTDIPGIMIKGENADSAKSFGKDEYKK